MHWCGLLIIAVTACSTADSVDIQIYADPSLVDVAHVELFVAGTPCTNCDDGIAPPNADAKSGGKVEFLIGTDRFYAATDDHHVAGFRLKPDGTDSTVPKLAAIGFDPNGAPVGFVVDDTPFDLQPLLGTIRRYTLVPQNVLQAVPQHPTTAEQVITWRTESSSMDHAAPSCLAFLNHDGGDEFFVPEADPDCDGFVAPNECDPTWYKRTEPDNEPLACVADDMDGLCQVGKLGTCVDGATTPTCTSIDKFCVPQAACATCMPPYDQACLSSIANNTVNGTRLRCTIPVYNTAINNPTTCINGSPLINLDQYYPQPCTVGFVQVGDPSGNISTSLDISTTNGDVVGTLDRTGYTQTCSFGFSTSIMVTQLPALPAVQKGALAITVGGAETLLMPVVVDYVAGGTITDCAVATSRPMCEIVPDTTSDTLFQCAAHQ